MALLLHQAKLQGDFIRSSPIRRLESRRRAFLHWQPFKDLSKKSGKRSRRSLDKPREPCTTRAGEQQAATSKPYGAGAVKELPIFPLALVAFPTGDVPLNIFEARYRVLFNTLLAGAQGIEEELVNHDKPWQGSRLFGMCYVTNEGGMASIGTTLHIVHHERLPDGRLYIVAKGVEKFKVVKVVEERPVLICQVMMLEDSDDRSQLVQELSQHDIQLFKDLVMLNVKMNRLQTSQGSLETKFDSMSPREISYWLALVFSQSPVIQQALLEESSLEKRLVRERDILEASTKFLRAKVALQTAFTPEDPISSEKIQGAAQGESEQQEKEEKSEEPSSGQDPSKSDTDPETEEKS